MSEFNFENFIENMPPYKKIELDTEDVKSIARTEDLRAELYCKNCEKKQTFIFVDEGYHIFEDINGANAVCIPMSKESRESHVQDPPQEDIYKFMNFYCAKCNEKYVFFFRTDRKTIEKVGQSPSFGDLQGIEINKYKNLISKYFIEFKSSINCYSQGKGIAAFVYLRRILEDLIEKIYINKVENKEENEKFIEKFKKVQQIEKVLPEEMEDIQNALYSVLSKGIHEYEEDECLNLYEAVKFIIEQILDRQLIEKQRQDKIKEVKKALNSKLNEKSN